MIFYLQRETPFICPDPQDSDSPLKQFLRGHLERIANTIQRESGPVIYDKFIDSTLHDGNELIDQVEAGSWIEAKQRLGYPATTNQGAKLAMQQTRKVIEFRRRAA